MQVSNTYKPSISEIETGLYLGDQGSSYDIPGLIKRNVTAIVSLSDGWSARWDMEKSRNQVPKDRHTFIPALDSLTQDLLAKMARSCDFIEEKSRDGNVLVHCMAGVSCSATVVVAYLMRKHHLSLDAALALVKENRRVRPNPNFMDQLTVWGETQYELWEDAD